MKRQSAFTLIELLITMVIGIILLAVGAPMLTNMMESNQSTALASELRMAMQLARSEAVKRGGRVAVCAANVTLTGCNAANWTNGWIVFTDDGAVPGGLDAGEVILRVWQAPEGQVVIAPAPNFVRYQADGSIASNVQLAFTITSANGQIRQLTVFPTGRVN